MAKRYVRVRCPICKKAVTTGDSDFPFCSERCRLYDLGNWASGKYVISSPVTDISDEIGDSQPEDRGKKTE
jgi:uncharacterized protein